MGYQAGVLRDGLKGHGRPRGWLGESGTPKSTMTVFTVWALMVSPGVPHSSVSEESESELEAVSVCTDSARLDPASSVSL